MFISPDYALSAKGRKIQKVCRRNTLTLHKLVNICAALYFLNFCLLFFLKESEFAMQERLGTQVTVGNHDQRVVLVAIFFSSLRDTKASRTH